VKRYLVHSLSYWSHKTLESNKSVSGSCTRWVICAGACSLGRDRTPSFLWATRLFVALQVKTGVTDVFNHSNQRCNAIPLVRVRSSPALVCFDALWSSPLVPEWAYGAAGGHRAAGPE